MLHPFQTEWDADVSGTNPLGLRRGHSPRRPVIQETATAVQREALRPARRGDRHRRSQAATAAWIK